MFNRLSIRQKLTALLMMTSAAVLGLACTAFVTWDYYRFMADLEVDLRTQAQIVLDNSTAAVTFDDLEAAVESLGMLEVHPHTQIACLYLPSGRLYAHRIFRELGDTCPPAAAPGVQITPTRMFVTERSRGVERGNMLMIGIDLDAQRSRLRAEGIAMAVIVAVGMLLSLMLASILQRIIATPISNLARTARQIGEGGDYSLRATPAPEDEIGVLVQSFNSMLDEIESSQRERADLLEREQQANRLKDEFLATLSHELRTPLNAIVGWVHLLRRGQLPPDEIPHALERIDRNAHAQARLVQDLLDVSRITSGKLLLDIRAMDLATVASNAIDACRPAAEARQVALRCEAQGAFPTMGDPDRLQQVLWNLISNAVRFTPAGGTVTVSLARHGAMDIVEVRDTGSGIEPQFLPHIFEPFRQADAASTRAHGGLGIGLTIVRRLTEMHGGTVTVASEGLGKGATLTVNLPVRKSSGVRLAAGSQHPRAGTLSRATVLIVEDDHDTLDMLTSTLRHAGANPIPASSVAAALKALDGHTLDAIVSDIAMPGQDGYTLLTLLRDRLGVDMPPTTIALTAYASPADRDRAIAAGFREHMAKPVNPDELVQTLRQLLADHATGRQ